MIRGLPVVLTLLLSCCGYASQTYLMADSKRIEATISPDSMNRIAVFNDRITQIFGDEGTFEMQNDESTGQIFLKPTAENGNKDLALTLITEQGHTQDVTLKPTGSVPATLLLKHGSNHNRKESAHKPHDEPFSQEKGLPLQANLVTVLKQAVGGQLPLKEGAAVTRSAPEGYTLTFQQSHQAGIYSVHVFEIQNTTETDIEIQEREFYRSGDMALSFQKKILSKGAISKFYVVNRA